MEMSFKLVFVVLMCALVVRCSLLAPFDAELDTHWENYKVKYQRKYIGAEEKGRRLIWEQNVQKINKHNLEADLGRHTYWMGINQFTDRTPEELDMMHRCVFVRDNSSLSHLSHKSKFPKKGANATLPDSVDWRDKGYVTGVKNQGNCGSCWAFSATGSLEGQLKATSGNLVSLSEQNLVDCSWPYGNYGCNGGLQIFAFSYVLANGGIDTEESYPYRGNDGDCRFNPSTVGAKITDYNTWLTGSEADLQQAVATVGPISLAIYVNENFMHYKSGVFYDSSCSGILNHGVLAVGYGKQGNNEYWIVKNSWGADWGMNGYILMARNRDNNCDVASFPSYPLM